MKLRGYGALISFSAGVALWAGAAQAADPQTAEVLGKLHHANQMEIAAGKLAQEKGQSKDVKSFGKTLVTDHTASDTKVMALAKEEKIELTTAAPMPDQMMDKLKTATGADFDKVFATSMLEDHKKDIAEAKAARDSTSDAKLKKLLTATIPVLEKHREIAQKLVDKVGPAASATGVGVPQPQPASK